ncbi:MAG: ABC transporter permease [Acholeplasma sp.]|jgi:putative ABC transport system permease protein|nr:ABC transporter permease [Acholeplasma sp.]
MFNHSFQKLKRNQTGIVFNAVYIIITVFVVFVLLSIRDISYKKLYSEIPFYSESMMLSTGTFSNKYPNGLKLNSETMINLRSEFDYVTHIFDVSLSTNTNQHIQIVATSDTFVETGVPVQNFKYMDVQVEKIELLYGQIWAPNTTQPHTIVDEDTARLVFGYTNVVGQTLETSKGTLTIVGVTSNTSYRQQRINRSSAQDEVIHDHLFPTTIYIPIEYARSQQLIYDIEYLVIKDDRPLTKSVDLLSNMLGLSTLDSGFILTKNSIVDEEMTSSGAFFQMIISLLGVFIVLGSINIINITTYSKNTERKLLGIYRVIGASRFQLQLINLYESIFIGLGTTLFAIILGIISILIYGLISNTLGYIVWTQMFQYAWIAVLIVTLLLALIHSISLHLFLKKPVLTLIKELKS